MQNGELAHDAAAAVMNRGERKAPPLVRPDERAVESFAHQFGLGASAIDGVGHCLGVVIEWLRAKLRLCEAIRESRAGLAVQIVEILDGQRHDAGLTPPTELTKPCRET